MARKTTLLATLALALALTPICNAESEACHYIELWEMSCCGGWINTNQCTGWYQYYTSCVYYAGYDCCGFIWESAHYESGDCWMIIEGRIAAFSESPTLPHGLARVDISQAPACTATSPR